MTDRTIAERSTYLPLWNHVTDEYHNAWLRYRPDDPYFVRIDIEDWGTIEAPRLLLLEGQYQPVVCSGWIAGAWYTLRARPDDEAMYALWEVERGGERTLFRSPYDMVARLLSGQFELVPMGGEAARIDWDAVVANLLPRDRP
ncbi:hypothetical protein ACQP1V_42870 (plasmid) [Microtetraspora malaysiensis]|uniref:hypothetical protein n=1 Tax=Microtetraspora malaysiensis TaxID=161358 RepID=UPI003D8D170F